MAQPFGNESQVQVYTQSSWSGGINTARPNTEIADTEAVDILNHELDFDDNLATRSGTQFFRGNGTTRVTSIFYFQPVGATPFVISTYVQSIITSDVDGSNFVETTDLTFPSNTYWQWKAFTNIAIGVNKGSTGTTNPVKVTAARAVSSLGGTPPKGNYIEVWNNRVWVAGDVDAPNQLKGSALGNAEDWTTAGTAGTVTLNISPQDGDVITGIVAFKQRLFIFKQRSIYVLSTGTPNTDPTTFRVDIYSQNIGCISAYTIQPVLDDILFLSESGVASLSQAELGLDYAASLLSRNVAELNKLRVQVGADFHAVVVPEANQYWVTLPPTASWTFDYVTYVFDYRRIQESITRWVRFDGAVAGSASAFYYINGVRNYLIGKQEVALPTNWSLRRYIPKDTTIITEYGAPFTKWVKTKAYPMNIQLIKKLFHKWSLGVKVYDTNSSNLELTINYNFDNSSAKGGSYGVLVSSPSGSTLWDFAMWDVDLWDVGGTTDYNIVRLFRANRSGRRALNVSFDIYNKINGQGYIIKDLQILFAPITEKRLSIN